MLAIQRRNKYISKVMMMPNGVEALVVFELIERNGKVIAKAVYAEAVDINTVPEQDVLCLPCVKSPTEFLPKKTIFSDLVSNFSKDYSFLTCLVTRAPNFN